MNDEISTLQGQGRQQVAEPPGLIGPVARALSKAELRAYQREFELADKAFRERMDAMHRLLDID